MQVTQADLNQATNQENQIMQQATISALNERVIQLRLTVNELTKLCEKNGIDWERELEKPKPKKRAPSDRARKAPAKKAASTRGS